MGILLYCRDQPLGQRSLALAAYNVLSKVVSAALIIPISEAIGQLKWTWFHGHESKEMIDFEIFDKASRGAWGSFLLLYRTKGRSLAALGAILTLLLLATDTFFQQVTDYPDRWALENVSSAVSQVIRYQPPYMPLYFLGWEESQYDGNIMPIVQRFLYGNGTRSIPSGNATRPEIPLSCPASNCTWPLYDSLAVCSQCAQLDVSELLTNTCLNTTIDWSAHSTGPTSDTPSGMVCGYFINATSDTPVLVSGYVVQYHNESSRTPGEALLVRTLPLTELYTKRLLYGAGSIHFKDIGHSILDAIIVSAINGSQSVYSRREPVVHECILSWCVKTIRSSYAWGSYDEEIVAIMQNSTAGPPPWDSFEVPDEEGGGSFITYLQNVTIEVPTSSSSDMRNTTAPDKLYGLSNVTAANTMAIFDDFFPSYSTADDDNARPSLRFKNYENGPSIRALGFNPWQAPNNITSHMDRLATAMTNSIRSNSDSSIMVLGSAYNRKQFILIRWEWLTFPFALLLASLGFLVATILKTSSDSQEEVDVWKTSVMPTLIYSLPVEVQKELKGSGPHGGKPRKVKIQLLPNRGWRVSGVSQRSPTSRRGGNYQPPPGWI